MHDRSIAAFHALLVKRRGVLRRLNAELAAQRADYAALAGRMAEIQADIDAVQAKLDNYDKKIETLMSGGRFELFKLNSLRVVRESVVERRAALQADLSKAKVGLERRAQLMAKTRREIVKNDALVDLYQGRIEKIHTNAAQRLEDMQDEETDEQQMARSVARRSR
jgi:chromosome segregation ATPase